LRGSRPRIRRPARRRNLYRRDHRRTPAGRRRGVLEVVPRDRRDDGEEGSDDQAEGHGDVRFELGTYAKSADERLRQLVSGAAAERIWRRDAAFWGGDDARRASVGSFLGWLDVATLMRERLRELRQFADEVRSAGFDAC